MNHVNAILFWSAVALWLWEAWRIFIKKGKVRPGVDLLVQGLLLGYMLTLGVPLRNFDLLWCTVLGVLISSSCRRFAARARQEAAAAEPITVQAQRALDDLATWFEDPAVAEGLRSGAQDAPGVLRAWSRFLDQEPSE